MALSPHLSPILFRTVQNFQNSKQILSCVEHCQRSVTALIWHPHHCVCSNFLFLERRKLLFCLTMSHKIKVLVKSNILKNQTPADPEIWDLSAVGNNKMGWKCHSLHRNFKLYIVNKAKLIKSLQQACCIAMSSVRFSNKMSAGKISGMQF
jgi:hypothetical protein